MVGVHLLLLCGVFFSLLGGYKNLWYHILLGIMFLAMFFWNNVKLVKDLLDGSTDEEDPTREIK